MSNHIEIVYLNRKGAMLRQSIDELARAVGNLSHIRDVMEQVASGGDWGAVEKEFGLPGETGEQVYNMVMASNKLTTYSEISELLHRMG